MVKSLKIHICTKGVIRRHKSEKDRQYNGQKFEDTKWVIRRHKSEKDRQYNGQKFEDTKGVIRRHKSEKDRQYNGQKKTDKRTNNDLQNATQKTKD
jgi:hypothetical protein